jgi:amino acid transporter
MTATPRRPVAATPGGLPAALPARLEPDAIGVTQDTVIGMASSAPAGTLAATLAALAMASAYGAGAVMVLTALPMVIIANSYRRLNLWSANCGASFEWVGRAINPYLGWVTGWLMVVGYIIGTVAEVVVLGPSVLAVSGRSSAGPWAYIAIDTILCLVMLVIAVVGIRITARTQLGMAAVEYLILIVFATWGLLAVLGHHPGTFPVTKGWFSLSGINGKGTLPAALLIAVYNYSLWDGTLYVNEEVKHRRVNPGRAAVIAVALLAVLYTYVQMGLQGVVSPARLQNNASTAMVYVAGALGGSGWAKLMALAIALSVTAATGTGIVLTARIVYGMAAHQTLPSILGRVSVRYKTPAIASVIVGLFIIAALWAYTLAVSAQSVFSDVVSLAGLLAAAFYVLTALATIAYYRVRIFTDSWTALLAGIFPLGAAAFLAWIMWKSIQGESAGQKWALAGILASGIVLMVAIRITMRPSFFKLPQERAGRV